MFRRWTVYAAENEDWKPAEQIAALVAYHDCALRLVHAQEDWKTTVVPQLFALAEDRYSAAGVVLTELLPELDPRLQTKSVIQVFQLQGAARTSKPKAIRKKLQAWLDEPSHRAEIQKWLAEKRGDAWEDLVIGLLGSGLADEAATATVKTRFGDESINRDGLLERLVVSVDDHPDVSQLLIDLLQHPALDAPASVTVRNGERTEVSRRALYVKLLSGVSPGQRPKFLPLLKELEKSGKNGESDAARRILYEW